MTEAQCLERAKEFLLVHDIGFLPLWKIGRREASRLEFIFPVPQTTDDRIAVADPPDVRVWMFPSNGAVELIQQM